MHFTCLLACIISAASAFCLPARPSRNKVALFESSSLPKWVERKHINRFRLDPEIAPNIFDSDEILESGKYLFQHLSLREIEESHKFALDYLGDFCVQCGAVPPIDIDKPLGDFMVGDQIASLITALNSLDPIEVNLEYDGPNLYELAYSLEIPPSEILEICQRENYNLPFGKETVLHCSLVDDITQRIQSRRRMKNVV